MEGTDEFIPVNELTISNAENGVACKAETNKGRNRDFPWKVTLRERSGEPRDDAGAVKDVRLFIEGWTMIMRK